MARGGGSAMGGGDGSGLNANLHHQKIRSASPQREYNKFPHPQSPNVIANINSREESPMRGDRTYGLKKYWEDIGSNGRSSKS